jgi:hypothetical protein
MIVTVYRLQNEYGAIFYPNSNHKIQVDHLQDCEEIFTLGIPGDNHELLKIEAAKFAQAIGLPPVKNLLDPVTTIM